MPLERSSSRALAQRLSVIGQNPVNQLARTGARTSLNGPLPGKTCLRWKRQLLGALALFVIATPAVFAFTPSAWIAERIENYMSDAFDISLDIGELDIDVLSSTTPGGTASDFSIGDGAGGTIVSGADFAFEINAGFLVGGDLVIERLVLSNAEIDLVVDEQGRGNWESLLQSFGTDEQSGPQDDPAGIPAIRSLDISDVQINYSDRSQARNASFALTASGSTIDPNQALQLEVQGQLDGLPALAELALVPHGDPVAPSGNLDISGRASIGDMDLSVEGTLDDPLGPDGFDPRVDFVFDAPHLQDAETLLGAELPALAPIEFASSLRRDGDDWILRRFDATIGSTAVEGDARMDPTTAPPTLYANLIVPTLYLDELLDALKGASVEEVAVVPEEISSEVAGSLLPDETLNLRPLARAVDGAIRLRIRDIVSSSVPLESLSARLEIDGDELILSPFKVGIAGGTIAGDVDLDVSPVPSEGTVNLRMRGIKLAQVARALDVDGDSFGEIGGRAKYWIRGDSVASYAADADGGLFLLMTGGKLDALLVELASIDVFESTLLLLDPGEALTNIDCGYLDLQTTGGLTVIERFVLDTADTVFIAEGTIDLAEESFDVGLEPHPKDPSLFEINAGVRVSGTPDDISVVPGVELGARAAAATALAAVATPVAALLAFVDTGGAEDSPYCNGLVGRIDEAR